jgi:acyl carrier protein
MADDTFEKFRECAVEVLQVKPEQVTMEASFSEDLDADSLDLVELVMALEEEDLEGVDTVGQAYKMVESKLA